MDNDDLWEVNVKSVNILFICTWSLTLVKTWQMSKFLVHQVVSCPKTDSEFSIYCTRLCQILLSDELILFIFKCDIRNTNQIIY